MAVNSLNYMNIEVLRDGNKEGLLDSFERIVFFQILNAKKATLSDSLSLN